MTQSLKGLEEWAPSLPFRIAPRMAELNHTSVNVLRTLSVLSGYKMDYHCCHLWQRLSRQYAEHTAGKPRASVAQLSRWNGIRIEVGVSVLFCL